MTAGYSGGKAREGEEGCYWSAECEGMPVTPTNAHTHKQQLSMTCPTPSLRPDKQGQALMHH